MAIPQLPSVIKDYTLMIQWVSICMVSWFALFIARIPRLKFSTIQFLWGAAFILFFQTFLWHPRSVISVRQMTIRTWNWWNVDVPDYQALIDIKEQEKLVDSPIKGSFTVKVIPYSSVEISVTKKGFCLPLDRKPSGVIKPVMIPLSLAGLPPWTVYYRVKKYAANDQVKEDSLLIEHEFVSFDADSTMDQAVTMYYEWPVSDIGLYEITSLKDAKGDGETRGDTSFEVVPCPEAFWKRSELEGYDANVEVLDEKASVNNELLKVDVERNICMGDSASIPVFVYGKPPLTLTFFKKGELKSLMNITLDNIGMKESNEQAIEIPSSEVKHFGSSKLFLQHIDSGAFEVPGRVDLFLTMVKDGSHSRKIYTENVDADQLRYHVFSRPSARIGSAEILEQPLIKGSKSALETPIDIQVDLEGEPPFFLEYYHDNTKHTVDKIQSNSFAIKAKSLGTYKLSKVQDSRCLGKVIADACEIRPLLPPTINIQEGVIEKPCFGQIGFSFEMDFTGKGPWNVKYELSSADSTKPGTGIKTKKFESLKENFQITPPEPGTYTLKFIEFRDSKYPHYVSIPGKPYTQTFHKPPDVTIKKYDSEICVGDDTKVPLELVGTAPWSLSYKLISPNNVVQKKIQQHKNKKLEISFPSLNDPGIYYLEFLEITDGNNCAVDLTKKSKPAQVKVFENRPTARFESPDNESYRLIEGKSLEIPVHLTGNKSPWNFGIERRLSPTHKWEFFKDFSKGSREAMIQVFEEGEYRIKNVRDAVCRGEVAEPEVVRVSFVEKPSVIMKEVTGISWNEFLSKKSGKALMCEADNAEAHVLLSGKPPFSLFYEISDEGRGNVEHESISVASDAATIPLHAKQKGTYRYSMKALTDDNYEKIALPEKFSFLQVVHGLPKAQFGKFGHRSVCLNNALKTEQFGSIDLRGESPWEVEYSLIFVQGNSEKEIAKRTISGITRSPYTFAPDTVFENIGSYRFRLNSVTDVNGCTSDLSKMKLSERSFLVKVSREPSLMIASETSYSCVTEYFQVDIQGIPPWKIEYSLYSDDEKQWEEEVIDIDYGKTKTGKWIKMKNFNLKVDGRKELDYETGLARDSIHFQFLKAGKLKLKTICHGSAGDEHWCCKSLDSLSRLVRPLPTVRVSSGSHDVDVIREGQNAIMKLEFTGTPPFTVTYVRRSEQGRVLENQSIRDINALHHELSIDKAGTFQVTAIQDKYCRFPSKKEKKSH